MSDGLPGGLCALPAPSRSSTSPRPLEVLARLPGRAACSLASSRAELGADCRGRVRARCRRSRRCRSARCCACPGASAPPPPWRMRSTLSALRRLAAQARYVTSVCTGSLLLGAAGLLRGRARRLSLGLSRVVAPLWRHPRSVAAWCATATLFTGGGVTAGIDMALAVAAEIAGRDFAKALQLAIEYAPEPPFTAVVRRPRPRASSRGARPLRARSPERRGAQRAPPPCERRAPLRGARGCAR